MSINKDSQKAPNLRFKGFTDDWEERKLGEISKIKTGSSDLQDADATGNYPFFVRSENIERSNRFLFEGEAILIPGEGRLGEIYHYINGKFDYHQRVYKISNFSDYNVQGLFVLYYLKKNFKRHALKYTVKATVDSLRLPTLLEFNIMVPNNEEQQKIGTFLRQIDNTITLHQRKLDQLNQLKEALLQQMFPGKGETVPKLRFAGFEGDWEERKLSSMTMYKNGKSHEDKQSTSGKYELINLNSISISGGLKHSGKFVEDTDDTLQKDDLVMILSDVGHGDLLGRVALIPNDNMFVLNQRVALLRPNETADPHFLFSYINAHQYYFKSQGTGMSQLNISKGSVENFTSNVPTIQEQNHIGSFFKSLDNTITLQQRKLDQLKNMKQVLLENMFI